MLRRPFRSADTLRPDGPRLAVCARRLAVCAGSRLVLAIAAAVLAAAMTRAVEPPAWGPRADRLFADWSRPDSPGCALGVFQDGAMVYSRGYGLADAEHDVPIAADTVFYVGSLSKQFTAMATALAIKHGKLSPDDSIRRYLPELPACASAITVDWLIGAARLTSKC
jgi:CubicO group peptidase (beta-lactamase class C family)